jgi:hypothetical protein
MFSTGWSLPTQLAKLLLVEAQHPQEIINRLSDKTGECCNCLNLSIGSSPSGRVLDATSGMKLREDRV